jgi:hypothetical protein
MYVMHKDFTFSYLLPLRVHSILMVTAALDLTAKRTNCKWCTACNSTQDSTKGFFTFTVSKQLPETHMEVISFMLIRKVRLSVCWYAWVINIQKLYVRIRIQPNWTVSVASNNKNWFMPLRKVSFSLHQFSQNSQLMNKFLWISSFISIQIAQV